MENWSDCWRDGSDVSGMPGTTAAGAKLRAANGVSGKKRASGVEGTAPDLAEELEGRRRFWEVELEDMLWIYDGCRGVVILVDW